MDLITLLPCREEPESLRECVLLTDSSNGDVDSVTVSASASSKRCIVDLLTWLEAYTIFVSVRISQHADRAVGLLAYQHLILTAAWQFMFFAVMDYDQFFRQLAEKDLSWR